MAEVVLFHHAQGLTDGVRAFARSLEGHTVHTPDLYEGKTFATLDEGMCHVHHPPLHGPLAAGLRRAGRAAATERIMEFLDRV